ncbi:MAG: SAM-dependent methyltransferase [Candidatus Methanomethylicota archaeon]|uniref:SAM-dependent methyltransferase n=1 Tax=Thermoproteota archaeon TaxID=2056631 RepID=A0A497EYV6_9CREN|nr:MAG: SAM-dependent methyltransferase [Candidatus Verstraetearchaeota archaeon]RLE52584.1 MAG: SAM-dependent methyltransferase [Candidatus Verstraetearchaeota archaeon]
MKKISPFVPTPQHVVRRALELVGVREGDVVYDLGSGDGRFVLTAAKEFNAKAVGIEIRRSLVEEALRRIRKEKLEEQAQVVHGDMFQANISDATVVTLYQLKSINRALRPMLEDQLKPGTRVVAVDFPIEGWKPILVEKVKGGWLSKKYYTIYVYVVKPHLIKDLKVLRIS